MDVTPLIRFPFARRQAGLVALAAALTACGGGLESPSASSTSTTLSATDVTADASTTSQDGHAGTLSVNHELDQAAQVEHEAQAAIGTVNGASSPLQVGLAELPPDESASMNAQPTDMQAQSVALGNSPQPVVPRGAPTRTTGAGQITLQSLPMARVSLLADIKPMISCRLGYVPPATLTSTRPATINGLLTLSSADLARLQQQLVTGPFVHQSDYMAGSPAELSRMMANAQTFMARGEARLTVASADGLRPTHGSLARDAAFAQLLQPDPALVGKLRQYLLDQASQSVNDLSALLCIRNNDGSVRDAWFGEASWLARYIVTYDAVRGQLVEADRLVIENFVRRNAYFLAAQLDYGMAMVFPRRAFNDYQTKASAAAPRNEVEAYLANRLDTNGDCRVTSADTGPSYWIQAYVRSDGTFGPRLSYLSQWYNNRKSTNAVAVGLAGLLLNDQELTVRAKRYFMEWLTYAVYSDGSEGEYARNGDYCIPNQGVVYAASNVGGALLFGDALARSGDSTLLTFSTREGLLGTEAAAASAPPKSIEAVLSTQLKLVAGALPWYRANGPVHAGTFTATNHLGRQSAQFNGRGTPIDNYQQVGFLLGAQRYPALPIKAIVLRDARATTLKWPGTGGQTVSTGYGSRTGAWTDVFNIYPTAFIQRAQ